MHNLQLEFEDISKNIDSIKHPEDSVVSLVEKYKYSKTPEKISNPDPKENDLPKYAFGIFLDQSRIYYGEYQIEEGSEKFKAVC